MAQLMKIIARNDSFSFLSKLVSIVFSLSVSNAFVELVFPPVAQWTDKRNSMRESSVKSLQQAKVNPNHSCCETYSVISKDKK